MYIIDFGYKIFVAKKERFVVWFIWGFDLFSNICRFSMKLFNGFVS